MTITGFPLAALTSISQFFNSLLSVHAMNGG